MCRPVKCNKCGKTTWAGCGKHIDQVKSAVPASEWCGHDQSGSAAGSNTSGFLGRLLGH